MSNPSHLIHGLYREGEPVSDTKAPQGPVEARWNKRKFDAALVNPANRRKLRSSSSAPASPAAPRRPRSARPATT